MAAGAHLPAPPSRTALSQKTPEDNVKRSTGPQPRPAGTQQTRAGAQHSQAARGLKRRQNDPHTQGRAVGLTRVFSCVHTYARGSLFARSGERAGTGWGGEDSKPSSVHIPPLYTRACTHARTPEWAAHSPEHSWEADTRAPLPQCGSRLGAQAAPQGWSAQPWKGDRLRWAMGPWNAQPRLSRARGKPASWRG